jgi:hypothetical protein
MLAVLDFPVTQAYANDSELDDTTPVRINLAAAGFVWKPADDLPGQWHKGLRDLLPRLSEHLGFMLGEGRPHMRPAGIRHGRKR